MSQAISSTPALVRPSAVRSTKANKIVGLSASSSSSFVSSPIRLAQPASATRTGRTALSVTARDAAWAPGSEAPAHLDGSMAGDFGFDPLGLGKDPERMVWYRQAELVHARFAMLGTVGILVPDILGKAGIGVGVPWYEAGHWDGYFAPIGSIFVTQLLMMGWAETRRWMDIKNPGSVNKDPATGNFSLPDGEVGYPGGIFDPFGWSKGDLSTLQLKEIKNGRLAMMAMLGFYVQHAVVGGTPVDNWVAHIADPWNTSILSNCSDLFVWDWANPSAIISEVAPIA